MVKEGIVLGHQISEKGIKVDRAKVQLIEMLYPPISIKGLRSSLSHGRFYRRLIKDLSRIAHMLCKHYEKKSTFDFDYDFLISFGEF